MYTPNFYLICALLIIGIILFVVHFVYDDDNDICIGAIMCTIFSLMIAFMSHYPNSKIYKTQLVENNTDDYMKVRYVQYHAFKENSLETIMLGPQQAKLLNRVKNVSTNCVNFSIKD